REWKLRRRAPSRRRRYGHRRHDQGRSSAVPRLPTSPGQRNRVTQRPRAFQLGGRRSARGTALSWRTDFATVGGDGRLHSVVGFTDAAPAPQRGASAVIERHTQELSQVVRSALRKVATLPIEIAARELVAAAIDAHRVDPKLHRVLAEEVPRAERVENIEAVERYASGLFRDYLEAHRDEIDVADLDLAAFILVTTVEALTHSAVRRRPDILADERSGEFVDEVTRLVLRYLRTPLRNA